MGWHWGVKGWGIIWIYVQLPDDFMKLFADLSPFWFDAFFLRNHHYEQHSELRKSAGQLRDEEVEVIAPICLDWRPQPMEIRRCCLQLTNFVVDKTRLLYNLGRYFSCLLPTSFFLSDLCRHHPSHPSPPKASLQNFLKTNKELVWKLKGETKQHVFFYVANWRFCGSLWLDYTILWGLNVLRNVIPQNQAHGMIEITITLTISLWMLESHYSHVKRSQVHHLHVPGPLLCLRCAHNRSRTCVYTTCWVKSEKGRHPS